MIQELNENMRVSQVVKVFPLSKASVWRFAQQGKIKAYKISDGVTIFKRSELNAFFSGKTQNVEVVA